MSQATAEALTRLCDKDVENTTVSPLLEVPSAVKSTGFPEKGGSLHANLEELTRQKTWSEFARRFSLLASKGNNGADNIPKVYGVIPSRPEEIELARTAGESLGLSGADGYRISTERGLSTAKNCGFRSLPDGGRDDIIVFIDNDTTLEGDLNWFRTRPESESFWVPRYVCHSRDIYSRFGTVFINAINAFRLWPASIGPCIVIRRWVAESHGFDEGALLEDLWFGATLKKAEIECRIAPLRAHVKRPFSPPGMWKRTNRDVHLNLASDARA